MRRMTFWIAVTTLMASALCFILSTASFYIAEWTGVWASYGGQTPGPFVLTVYRYSGFFNLFFQPLSLIALAFHLVFVERERHRSRGRGFDIETLP